MKNNTLKAKFSMSSCNIYLLIQIIQFYKQNYSTPDNKLQHLFK